MKQDFSNTIAADMDKALNSEENKKMFSSSSMLEKLAFKKVSEQDQITEVEMELDSSLKKTASCKHCECEGSKKDECKCDCHESDKSSKKSSHPVLNAFNSLLKISEVLDTAGFDKIAAASLLLAGKLISEAKAKSSKKSDKKSDKKEDKSKSKSKKMDMKERMKKMRDAQKGKGKKEKSKSDSKKVSKAQFTGQDKLPPQELNPVHAPKGHEAVEIMNALPPAAKGAQVEVELDVVKVHPANLVPVVTKIVQNLQEANKLPFNRKYRVVPA